MEILEKIKQAENRKLEIKRSLPSKQQWLKAIVAFANGAGGEMIFGVEDNSREIVGVENPFDLEEKISNTIHDSIRPTISPYIQIVNLKNRQILCIQILPGAQKPYYLVSKGLEKGTYIRIGSTSRQADFATIEELKRQSYGISYLDQLFFQAKKKDLDKNMVNTFFKQSLKINNPLANHFHHYSILKKNNGDIFPSFIGMILFGKKNSPKTTEFEYAKIKITVYSGSDRNDILSAEFFEPPLSLKIDNIINYALSKLPVFQKLAGAKIEHKTLLPEFAVRESIINAIVHRDYSLRGSSVQVDIFDDRCEVISPGVLSGSLNIDLLGQGISEIRNRSIVRLFRQAGFMEELGSGIPRLTREMENLGNPKPEFEEKGQYFQITLKMKPPLPIRLQILFQILKQKGALSSSEISKEIKIHQNTSISRLKELIELELVEKTGLGKNTKYQVK